MLGDFKGTSNSMQSSNGEAINWLTLDKHENIHPFEFSSRGAPYRLADAGLLSLSESN
ncbi:hypothetical protein [Roseovarius indicus]|uniref:hypothetical protein n=1 Tax=Roseovarius indicus TaxID=540747 RepID=UPI0032EE2A57